MKVGDRVIAPSIWVGRNHPRGKIEEIIGDIARVRVSARQKLRAFLLRDLEPEGHGPTFRKLIVGRTADLDPPYRYKLGRVFSKPGAPTGPLKTVLFIMLNPSTANHEVDDPTIRRNMDFALTWGYNHLLIGNLFAWVEPNSKNLAMAGLHGADIRGPRNNPALLEMASEADLIVCAWGKDKIAPKRAAEVYELLRNHHAKLQRLLDRFAGPAPHPLYLPKTTQLLHFQPYW